MLQTVMLLIGISSALVGVTDVTEPIVVSRQDMRKLMLTNPGSFLARYIWAVR